MHLAFNGALVVCKLVFGLFSVLNLRIPFDRRSAQHAISEHRICVGSR